MRRVLGFGLSGLESVLEAAEDAAGDALRTTRFLRGRIEFSPRPDDVYVASYPRSGTTWVQFILYLLRSDRTLTFEHISEVSPWWERSMALGSRRASDFESIPSPRVFKSHLPRRWLPSVGRFVYVVRDGLDVALSYHHLYRSHLGFRGDFSTFFERFLQGHVQYGSWFKHVEGWERFRDTSSVHWLAYETLRTDLEGAIRGLATFLEWPTDASLIDEVKGKAGFEFMKAHEMKFDPITETLIDQGLRTGRFIRQGKSGEGVASVNESMRSRFNAVRASRRRRPDVEHRLPAFLH